jgi:hypothetical protein
VDLTNTLTVEEENLICAFDTSGRTALIGGIAAAMPDFDEPGISEIAGSALAKLRGMTDAEFSALTLCPAYHGDDEEETEG